MSNEKQVTLSVSASETNFILQVLGELPTKSGAFPLAAKIQQQANEQLAAPAEPVKAGGTE